jgi:hypothetical protein
MPAFFMRRAAVAPTRVGTNDFLYRSGLAQTPASR